MKQYEVGDLAAAQGQPGVGFRLGLFQLCLAEIYVRMRGCSGLSLDLAEAAELGEVGKNDCD
jgi:hypothetical protein